MNLRILILQSCLVGLCGVAMAQQRTIFRSATVYDGGEGPPRQVDVLVEGDRILRLGNVEARPGDREIRGEGMALAPGFIDIHSHSKDGLQGAPQAMTQVSQGITTVIVGADGSSPFPPAAYLGRLEEKGIAVNVGLMAGHGTVRRLVMGEDYKRPAGAEEIESMKSLVRLAMAQGTFGLSSGLEYDPGFYSETAELIALARQAAQAGGFYMSHIRDEEDGFVAALEEALRIGREAGLPVQISHIKLGNTRVWGRTPEVFRRLEKAVARGLDVTADCYPYDAWASGLSILVPSRKFHDRSQIAEGFDKIGGAQNVLITRYPPDKTFEFRTLPEIAQEKGISVIDLFIQMIDAGGAGIVGRSMNPEDVHAFYRHPLVMVASDGGTDSRHPRMSGSFPRVLGRFVRERSLFPLQTAIHKMSAMPARRLGLKDRGRIHEGFKADLTLFDPARVIDRSDFKNHARLSEGIRLTMVNGVVVWEEGAVSGQLPGRVLRRGEGAR